jgi:hypothetical protein
MRKVVNFYQGKKVDGFTIHEVLRLDDKNLQENIKIFDIIFPENLPAGKLHPFKTNANTQKLVIIAVLRVLSLIGYKLTEKLFVISNGKTIKRMDGKMFIGLYNENTQNLTVKVLEFLQKINMQHLSALFFLSLCYAIKEDKELSGLLYAKSFGAKIIKTQPFLEKVKYEAEEGLFGLKLEDWEKSQEEQPLKDPFREFFDD